MANVNYTVPTSANSSTAYGSDTLATTLELGDTLTLQFGTQGSGWTFSQADSFFNSTDVGGSHSTDTVQNTTDDYVIDCDGSYPSGSQTTLNIFKSANTGSSPYLTLTVNTRSLDSTITKDLIHNGSSINGFPIYYSPNGNVTFSYTNGGAYTRYRVITTSASSSPSGTVINGRGCGNSVGTSGTVDIEYKVTGNELCNIEGSQVSYKVQYRPRNLASTYQDTGTTFTLTHIVSSPGTISVSNAGNSSQTETVTVSCAINPPTDCILEFSTSSNFSSNVLTADGNREADFSQARNSTVTYYARFRNTTTNAVTFGSYPSVSHTVNYLPLNDNEISMTVQSVTVAPNYSGSVGAFSYTNGGASGEYRLVSNNTPAFEVDGAQSGSSGSWTVSSSELPPVNTTWTYFVQGQRQESQGGQPNSWAQTTITGSAANELTIFRQNYTAADTTFTTTSPTINWDAASFNTTLTGVQIGDEVQVTLNSDIGVVLEDWTAITSTTQVITCNAATVNSTNLPNGQTTTCRVRVRRPTSNDGDGNVAGFQTLAVTRNYRVGPFGSVAVTTPAFADRTIGAQEFIAYGGTQQDVRITGSGVISGATYICRINSGTTSGGATSGIVYSRVASGTEPNAATTAGGLSVSQLPAVGNTVEYIVKCIVPTNLGGDGTTEHDCTTLTIPLPTSTLTFDMIRSAYVQPDGTITITSSATLVSGSDYRIGASSTSETVSYTDGSAVTEYRLSKMVGSIPSGGTVDTASGGGGTFTVGSSDLPPNPGDEQGYTVEFRVPETSDGTGQWFSNIQANSLLFQREELIQPTLGTLQAYANSSNLAQVVPTVERTNNSGNGLIEYAWSSTNSTPTNWTSLGALGYVAGFDVAAGGISRSATNLYMGMREKSPIDGTTTAATYVSNTNGPFYNEVDTLANRLITMTYNGVDYEPSLGEQVIIDATELTNDVTVKGSLSSSLAKTAYTETQVTPGTAGFSITSSVTNYSSFSLRTDAAATLNGVARSANYLVGSATGNSVGNAVLTISNPDEIVDAGNTLGYTLYEYVFTARGGDGIEVATTPAIDNNMVVRRRGVTDDTITVTGVRQTLANNHSTDLVLTVADGSSGTEYQLYSQGSEYDTVVGNGTLTATNPGELPTAGNTRSYNVRWREAGSGDSYQTATGTGTSFTVGRLNPMNLGALSNPVSIDSSVNSATITLGGAVGTITALLTKNSGGGTVRLSKNGQTFANSTASGTSITVVDGDTLAVRAESPGTYSNTTTCTLTLTQDSVTIFSDTYSFTTEANPGGSTGGGGGTGNYGLEIRDSSGNVIITNSDRVGDFCYATTVTVASGASSGVSTTQAVGGNVVIIEENLNPNNEDDRVYATLENNGKEVRINMLGVTASTTLTFNVLVFNV